MWHNLISTLLKRSLIRLLEWLRLCRRIHRWVFRHHNLVYRHKIHMWQTDLLKVHNFFKSRHHIFHLLILIKDLVGLAYKWWPKRTTITILRSLIISTKDSLTPLFMNIRSWVKMVRPSSKKSWWETNKKRKRLRTLSTNI